MSKRFLGLAIFLLLAASASAHPGIGIVRDSRGNIFYTDLKQVWKISPDGKKSLAVANVHTHELYLDANDNLYGEHLWYEGEATDKWKHRVWKRSADGIVTDVIPAREGFREGYQDCNFVRDHAGNMYWMERGTPTIIRRRTPEGVVTDFCKTHDFRDVRWMTASASGTVYLIDDDELRCIQPDGSVSTIASHLKERVLSTAWMGGLWLDVAGNVYVAIYGGQLNVVKKINRDGQITITAHSNAPWGPTGGLNAPNGDLWLLEYSTANAARVRQIRKDGTESIY